MTRNANPDLPNQILEQARHIVVTEGHHKLNMRDLAARVGVSATAIYHYFENKEELLFQLKIRAAELLNSRIRSIGTGLDPMEILHRLGKEYIGFAEEQPNLYRLLFETPVGEGPYSEDEHPVIYFTYYTARRALEQLAERGLVGHDPRYGAMMGWIMLHGFCSLVQYGNLQLVEGMNKEDLKELFISFYTKGGKP